MDVTKSSIPRRQDAGENARRFLGCDMLCRMRKATLVVALAVSAVVGLTHADGDGYSLRGQQADFGSALVNGLVAFWIVAVPLCGFALVIADGWHRLRRRS